MRFCSEYCLEMPDDFPADEFTKFMAAARHVLLAEKGDEWREFGGASNLIGWRYRTATECWNTYRLSWHTTGAAVDHEGIYLRERALFGMFSAGVACIESTAYALAALCSHPTVLALPFGPPEQRVCSPKKLLSWIEQRPAAAQLAGELRALCDSNEWRSWVELRNRMTHRSNLPRVIFGAVGSAPPVAKPLHFAATSSTPPVEGDLEAFDKLHVWLTTVLRGLLVVGGNQCPK